MKYYTAIEKNKEVLFVFKGIDLQDRLLGENSKKQISVKLCAIVSTKKKEPYGKKKKIFVVYV